MSFLEKKFKNSYLIALIQKFIYIRILILKL